ncbi:acyl-CoA dehydrogenase family protein [Dactylosporangium sucinum]|uniref:Long-chain-acyl-CoA dehydrogenase n=1 Tax=Dactylosporangium sucinum TaxID=1424081 RepID=A0A917U9R9_9ACTN|nr:acyl-CoA dehydrogenase family protein [Dactylosporangium sucinum]GGM64502.1 long-chain-acyl-CoA dehydrogenase [Dactylosporangium sucinum]
MTVERTIFTAEHDAFRVLARSFFDKECAPHAEEWEHAGQVDRELWRKAGAVGLLGWEAPTEYGGLGIRDFRYNVVMTEEYVRSGSTGFGFALHNDVMPPYLIDLTTGEQQRRWLPGYVSGDIVTAIAMTEPDAGSDLKNIRTTAVDAGDHWLLSGAKTYITNGILSDLVIVAARTDPGAGHRGISLLAVERGMPGFSRGRNLDKIGLKAQDTAELFFEQVAVPKRNLVGELNRGFYHLMAGLTQERLACAVTSTVIMERALALTTDFVRNRRVYGNPLSELQNTQFRLAEVKAAAEVCRVYTDRAIAEHVEGRLTADDAAIAKMFVTERQWEAVDACLQLFGGAGYMNEYEIARLWRDTRVQRILAGSSEVMRHIIGRKQVSEA